MFVRLNHSSAQRSVCVCDADTVRRVDPTGTGALRRKYRNVSNAKWLELTKAIKALVINQDFFGLASPRGNDLTLRILIPIEARVESFGGWLEGALLNLARPETFKFDRLVDESYKAATARAMKMTGKKVIPMGYHATHIRDLATLELRGIVDAVKQNLIRLIAFSGDGQKPASLYYMLSEAIRKIGVNRTNTLIEIISIKAFSMGTLDQFELAGVTHVGLVPEYVVDKGLTTDVKKKKAIRATGPGSRLKGRQPSKSTLYRIRKVQKKLERYERVEVVTAGDDRVCPICEEIAEGSPYTISVARSLIPAHPRCRCAFAPVTVLVGDAFDPNQPRDPEGKWSKVGGSVVAYHGTTKKNLKSIKKNGIQVGKKRNFDDPFGDLYAGERGKSVYVTNKLKDAQAYAENIAFRKGLLTKDVAILEVHIPAEDWKSFKADKLGDRKGSALSGKNIKPEWIKKTYGLDENYKPVVLDASSGDVVLYFVIELEDDSIGDAYNPNQKRAPKGSEQGGQWVSSGFVPDPEHPMSRDDGNWGSSHSNSHATSAAAAKLMGIDGYDSDALEINKKFFDRRANKFLEAVYNSPGTKEPLYHGFENRTGIKWSEGDTVSLPLVATTGGADHAAGYGIRGFNWKDDQGEPTMFEFPVGTRIAGYSRWRKEDAKEFGHQWSEALTSGNFRIVSTRVDNDVANAHWKPAVRIVRLEPIGYFNPSEKKWEGA